VAYVTVGTWTNRMERDRHPVCLLCMCKFCVALVPTRRRMGTDSPAFVLGQSQHHELSWFPQDRWFMLVGEAI